MRKSVIGIDIGGTKMRGILWNGKKVLKFVEFSTPNNLKDFESNLKKIVNYLGRENKIAVGAAGIIKSNILVKSPNIPYIKNFKFCADKLDNDARCFARTERSLLKTQNIFFITLGTGVGRAVVEGGEVLKIKKLEYPETWERQYQKICDIKDDDRLAEYVGRKIVDLAKTYKPEVIVIGGGILNRKGFFGKLKRDIDISIKRAVCRKNAVAIGAAKVIF
ncbi:MAG: ROK family protein [bacterium]|nr:ROK family protein [bacterium]